jgi:hypothetical protein
MVNPWRDAGYRCICLDIQHPHGVTVEDGIEFVGEDVRTYLPPLGKYKIVFGFPPCTHLAVSGARWFASKGLSALHEVIGIVEATRKIYEWAGVPYIIENPVSTLSTYWRKPDHIFNPFEYGGYLTPPGDAYNKRTCLWVGNGFILPTPKPVEPTEGSKMHLLPPSPERSDLRSETPMGFAIATFEANKGKHDLSYTG